MSDELTPRERLFVAANPDDELTPRERLFVAANPDDDVAFAAALNDYRDKLIQSLRAVTQYCPYDCGNCHDTDTCLCPNCERIRKDAE